ncbi:hypothetical protein, conserved in T. vivax [Trypanosoma vivax Y486]|uniref:Uncharacterized protein n=1 Tax=Trypanosoma vivax (strain Y486) TaxID=1055687 RepID=F9WQ79_TRYVY|nr:hypothetical protein, conserved in T. vivax [Trypanosoma vivax Y486]|eukprot:CCD19706.1 hypothetical protein, conserved in T. vivax [Trypanosoma vivax Y486]
MSARRVRWVRNCAGTQQAKEGRLNKGNVRGDMAAGPNAAKTTTNMAHNRTPQHARADTKGVDRHADKRAEKKGTRKAKTCTATSGSTAQGNKEGNTRQGRRWHLREPRMRTHRAKALEGKNTAVKMAPAGGTRIRTEHVHRAHKHGSNKPQVTRERSAAKERQPHEATSPERQRRKKTGAKGGALGGRQRHTACKTAHAAEKRGERNRNRKRAKSTGQQWTREKTGRLEAAGAAGHAASTIRRNKKTQREDTQTQTRTHRTREQHESSANGPVRGCGGAHT